MSGTHELTAGSTRGCRTKGVPSDTFNLMTPILIELGKHTSLFNAAGTPCLAQPIPVSGHHLPASLQLVGPWNSENLLLATAERIATTSG